MIQKDTCHPGDPHRWGITQQRAPEGRECKDSRAGGGPWHAVLTQLCSSSSRVTTITSPLEKVSSRALSPLQSTTAFTRFCLPLACTRNGVNDKGKGGEGGSSTPTPIHIRCDPPNPSILGRGQQGCSPICCTPLCFPPPHKPHAGTPTGAKRRGMGTGGTLLGVGSSGLWGGVALPTTPLMRR